MLLDVRTDEKLIAQILDTQPDSAVWFTPIFSGGNENEIIDLQPRYCNAAACRILNVDRKKILSVTLLTSGLMDDVSRRLVFDQCKHVWITGEPIEFTYYSPGLDKYFNVQRSKVLDGILSITRDRTKEVKAEKEREQQALLLTKIINNSPTCIVFCEAMRNAEGKIYDFKLVMVNDKIVNDVKRPKEEIESLTYCQLHPAVATNGLIDILAGVVEKAEPFRDDVYLDVFGGWFHLSVDRVDENRVIATYLNIHESKTHTKKIEEQADLLSKILNSSLNGVYTVKAVRDGDTILDFEITHVNDEFCRMSSKAKADLIGKHFTKVFPDTIPSGIFARNCELVHSGKEYRNETHYKGDGVDIWLRTSVVRIGDDSLVISFNDITDLKTAAVKLEESNQELIRSNQRLTEFTHVASHDLNEPLRKIITYSQLLQERFGSNLEAGAKDYLGRITKTTLRMQTLINDLLTYSRLSAGLKEKEIISLNKIVNDVKTDLERLIQEKNTSFMVTELPSIKGDKTQLRQVFQNLISNAIKFQRADTTPIIHINNHGEVIRHGKTYHMIAVTDNGIGFEKSEIEKIFQLFQRLHGRSEYEGTGIGLAIVEKAMQNHDGFVEVESEPKKGSSFYLLFPVG